MLFRISTIDFSDVYEASSEQEALDFYARDAGYADFADLLRRVPGASVDDLKVTEIPETNETRKEDLMSLSKTS